MWRKRKEITGVSSSSIVDLKAHLFAERQESTKFSGESHTTNPSIHKPLLQSLKAPEERGRRVQIDEGTEAKNKGVEEREERDKKIFDEEQQRYSEQNIDAKMRAKVELYEKLKKGGELNSTNISAYDDGPYLVDFQRREWETETKPDNNHNTDNFFNNNNNTPTEMYARKPSLKEEEMKKIWNKQGQEEEIEQIRKKEKKERLDQVVKETKEGREKVQESKDIRKKAAQDRLNMINKTQKKLKKKEKEKEKKKVDSTTT
eukprot:TRINITY_DN1142_c1_g1_i1.p1 TRINITY_DN1142_c1_g1~~TRINITY_DN1142_c1_g1_i1.p1  ORF type:complete len:260 (-),score=92.10 TRINITY_DN1142_c1_g1_i1:75-854(-)